MVAVPAFAGMTEKNQNAGTPSSASRFTFFPLHVLSASRFTFFVLSIGYRIFAPLEIKQGSE
jgi:hypothetical protein